ncbi:MAG: hypothetical protein QF441_04915 [Bacteriovoracaceae bacterium]|jgi:hypothetical protein|nr:hypothetical protein [Halobacteriovoraceae bacterium]MDP7319924.1 hypothetical protein [Bacteriovoracaceae bacterium]
MTQVVRYVFIMLISMASYNALSCFPESDVKIPVQKNTSKFLSNQLTKAQMNGIIHRFKSVWEPIIREKYDKKLIVKDEWDNKDVDAYATRDMQDNPIIVLKGGLVRHPQMSENGLLLILCHELGHHYGGAPKSFRGRSTKRSWSSAEGQADYFATNKCMSKIFEMGLLFDAYDFSKTSKCKTDLCLATFNAAMSVSRVFASLKLDWSEPNPNSESSYRVSRTFYGHPKPQCRFDTYIAGSLCVEKFDSDFDDENYAIGSCTHENRPEAARPTCWFSPQDY